MTYGPALVSGPGVGNPCVRGSSHLTYTFYFAGNEPFPNTYFSTLPSWVLLLRSLLIANPQTVPVFFSIALALFVRAIRYFFMTISVGHLFAQGLFFLPPRNTILYYTYTMLQMSSQDTFQYLFCNWLWANS